MYEPTGPKPTFIRAALLLVIALPAGLRAASYLPLPDADLVRRSPVVVEAEVVGETDHAALSPGESGLPYSLVPLRVLDVLKGVVPEEILVRLPGGIGPGGERYYVPGTPLFQPGERVILFLASLSEPGQYVLTEFALSKFDVLEDDARQLFAVRSTFQAGEDLYLSAEAGGQAEPDAIRELPSLVAAVRSAYGSSVAEVRRGRPVGALRPPSEGRSPLWVNLLGREGPTVNLVRWFWDTGQSMPATVKIVGTQSNLTDGTNGTAHVQSAITQWGSIPSASVQISGPAAAGIVTVALDVDSYGSWTTPMDCNYGYIGRGGILSSTGPLVFRGESRYYAATSGNVWMRRSTCTSPGYLAAIFQSAVAHELGHALGLGHPDLAQSIHSTTVAADWNAALMRSTLTAPYKTAPQTDDTQAMQYLYPVAAACTYAISPASSSVAASAATGTVTVTTTAGCAWTAASNSAFVTVTSGASASGSGTVSYSVAANAGAARSATITIAGQAFTINQSAASGFSVCAPSSTTLCISSRFKVQVGWHTSQGGGQSGTATAVSAAPLGFTSGGIFWFFDPSNPEMLVKVLNGCAVNNRYWVYGTAGTNVGFTMTVTDTTNGTVKPYVNPDLTSAQPIQDREAFATCP